MNINDINASLEKMNNCLKYIVIEIDKNEIRMKFLVFILFLIESYKLTTCLLYDNGEEDFSLSID